MERVPHNGWARPGLGAWNVPELTGHPVSAGLRAVLTSLAQPAERSDIPTAAGYYALARTVDPAVYRAAVAASEQDARREGATLETVQDKHLVRTPAGGMPVVDWRWAGGTPRARPSPGATGGCRSR